MKNSAYWFKFSIIIYKENLIEMKNSAYWFKCPIITILKTIYKENPIEVQNILISKSFVKKILLKWKILPIGLNVELFIILSFIKKIQLEWKFLPIGLNVEYVRGAP